MRRRQLPSDPREAAMLEPPNVAAALDPNPNGDLAAARLFLTAREFLGLDEEKIPALLGNDSGAPLVAGGLLIMGGEGGASKTTLTIDAVAHLASGLPWLGVPVPRPLTVVFIENEGPRSKFREKLETKAEHWQDPEHWVDRTHIYADPWGRFSFADAGARRDVREYAASVKADLVVADPLGSLGLEGAGSPEETRAFVDNLKDVGLFSNAAPLAFWLLHHHGKQKGRSDVQALSGDWGGHADTIMAVRADGDSTLLHWAKCRWDGDLQGSRWLLRWDGTGGYERGEIQPKIPDEELEARIIAYLTARPGESLSGNYIAEHVKGGRGRILALLPELEQAGRLERGGTERRARWALPGTNLTIGETYEQ